MQQLQPEKNPYALDTPERCLFAQEKAAIATALRHEAEARRHSSWAYDAHKRAEKYSAALRKLTL